MMIHPSAAENYQEHARDLIAYATTLVGASDAEDLVADAMVRALSHKSWESVRQPRGYLFRAVLNQARDRGRRAEVAQRHRFRLVERHRSTSYAGSADPADGVVSSAGFRDVLEHLSVRERAVVHLTYWHDLRAAEVGELLDISEGTVKKYLVRARAKLREVLTNV